MIYLLHELLILFVFIKMLWLLSANWCLKKFSCTQLVFHKCMSIYTSHNFLINFVSLFLRTPPQIYIYEQKLHCHILTNDLKQHMCTFIDIMNFQISGVWPPLKNVSNCHILEKITPSRTWKHIICTVP